MPESEIVRLQNLVEAAAKVHASLELGSVVQALVVQARNVVPANIAVIHVGEEPGIKAVSVAEKFARWSFDEALGQLDTLVDHAGHPLRLSHDELERNVIWGEIRRGSPNLPPFRGWLAVSLVAANGKKLGVLQVSDRIGGEFTAEDEALLVKLAQIGSAAIVNAQQFESAQQGLHSKDEFIATMSHELRTPLNAMLGWTTMLLSGKLDAVNTNRGVHVLERSIKWQAKLIEDLLDTSRIITGKLRIERRQLAPAAVVEAAVEALRPAAEAKSLRLEAQLDRTIPMIAGDADRLQQVVGNLISNSVKFTPAGGRIEVKLERLDTRIRISVIDTGKGITAALLPHVFERFRQADSSTRRSHSGLGLGLAIARNLVELHGGSVHAESDGEGQGARFTVYLPFVAADSATARAIESGAIPSLDGDNELKGLRVMIVEDETNTRELFQLVLSMHGAEVVAFGSAAEALVRFRQWHPHVIVSDLAMPETDGFDFIRQIRAMPGGKVPAIALSAFAKPEERERALSSGFNKHVAKPIEPEKLVGIVAKYGQQAVG